MTSATLELAGSTVEVSTDPVWTASGGSIVPFIPYCGRCGAFMPETYISLGRYTGRTIMSKCCKHRLETEHRDNISSYTFNEEPVDVTLDVL